MNLASHKNSKKNNKFVDFANAKSSIVSRRSSVSIPSSGKKNPFKFGRKKANSNPNESKAKRILKKVGIIAGLTFLFSIFVGILFVIGLVSVYSKNLPNIEDEFKKSAEEGKETIIVDRNNKELYRLQGTVIKERVYNKDIPDNLKWAFLAAEDAEFYNHKGLNLFGLARAFTCAARNGGEAVCGGGSSITQQVIKNTTTLKEYSIERKAKEAVLAMKAEQEYTKEELLELYLNVVPMGSNVKGVKTGSSYIYGEEDLNKLSLAQIAYLAAIPNEPSSLSPLGGSYYSEERSRGRAEYILNRMIELHGRKDLNKSGVTVEELEKAKSELDKVAFQDKVLDIKAPHYVNYALEKLDAMYGDKVDKSIGERGRDYIRGKGYTLVLAVDLETQEMLEKNLRENIPSKGFQDKVGAQTGAAVMMDPRNGEILALVGSKDFFGKGDQAFSPQSNEAKNPRSLGSTIKPIGYLGAFRQGYHPSTVLPDFQINLASDPRGAKYEVLDYGGTQSKYGDPYTGRSDFVTMRTALKQSLNIPAVTNYHLIGGEAFADTYVKLSGYEKFRESVQGPSAAIGSVNSTLISQVHAYATMASEGVFRQEKVILEIKDDAGNIVYDNKKVEGKQVIEKKYIFLINDMNKRYWKFEADPLLKSLNNATNDFGGKTGTADNNDNKTSDVAFVGYNPNFVLGMWAGNTKNSIPIKQAAAGEDLYTYLYKPFLEQYKSKIVPGKFVQPADVKKVEICNLTGRAKSDKCTYGSHFDFVADAPKSEEMIEVLSVTPCGDTEKLARQIDKDMGLAQNKSYFIYKFPVKRIQDEINAKKNLSVPTELCNLDRQATAPKVTIVSPAANGEVEKNRDYKVTVFVTSDIPIQKVDVFIDDVLVKSFSAAPYEATLSAVGMSNGNHKITVVAVDTRGPGVGEGRAESTFKVTNNPVTSPTPTPTSGLVIFPTKKNQGITPTPTVPVTVTPTSRNWGRD